MVRLVFIPSYGTDSSLYDSLRDLEILDQKLLFTDWLPVGKSVNLQEYSSKFIESYGLTKDDILIGTSLGGVLAIEINKLLEVKKIIAISTITTKYEKPKLFRFFNYTKTYKLFAPKALKFGLDLVIPFYGKKVGKYLWFRKVFKRSDNEFLRWALAEIVKWQNEEAPSNLTRIHGTNDPVFPLRNSKAVDYIIKGGNHAMIRFKAREIAEIIERESR